MNTSTSATAFRFPVLASPPAHSGRDSVIGFPESVYAKNAELYKIMANAKRLHVLNLLALREMTVEELARALRVRTANVSQHLAVLRANRFVYARREGVNVYYRISDSRIVAPCRIFKELHGL